MPLQESDINCGELFQNSMLAFLKNKGLLAISNIDDKQSLKQLESEYAQWCFGKNLFPHDKDNFFKMLYAVGIISATDIMALVSENYLDHDEFVTPIGV